MNIKNKYSELFRFLFWSTLAFWGQYTALHMIRAGNFLRYQHYKPFDQLLQETSTLVLFIFFIQLLAVGIGLWRFRNTLISWLNRNFKTLALLFVALVFGLTSATVSQDIYRYLSELLFAAFVQFINLGNIFLVILALPDEWAQSIQKRTDRWLGPPHQAPMTDIKHSDRFVWIAALWVIILSSGLALFSYQNHPHVQDEVAYLIQARYLANGRLVMPAPPVPEAFDMYLMQFSGEDWYPSPPVGWPALLSLGVRLGVPWLVNPLLAGINLWFIFAICSSLYSTRLARIIVLLIAVSPWYVFMGMNFMTHMLTLTCALSATWWVMRSRQTGEVIWAIWAGLALGIMSLIRPIEGLIWAVLMGLWAIGIGGKRLSFASITGLVTSTALISMLVLPYNAALTGNPRVFPINAYTNERFGENSNAFGFGPDRGMGWAIDPNPGHSPIDGLINANLNSFATNIELFGWSTGSLLLVAVFLASFRFQQSDYLMFTVLLAVFGVFFFYYFSGGPDFGARYWFLMIVPLAALSARGIQLLESMVKADPPVFGFEYGRILAGVLISSMLALVTFFPWRAIDKYYHYLGMIPDILDLENEYSFEGDLILVRGDNHPDYSSAATYNPIDLTSPDTIYAWDRSPAVRQALVLAYPDRMFWLVDGPSLTKDGYQVVAGPLFANELSSQPK